MNSLTRLLGYRVYRRLVSSYLILVVATVIALSAVLYALFASSATKELAGNARSMLERSAYAADIVRQQVVTVGGQLANSPDVEAYLYGKTVDRIVEFHAIQAIDRLKAFNPVLQSVGLYNGYTGRYINDAGFPPSDGIERASTAFIDFFPRRLEAARTPNKRERQLLTFILTPRFSFAIPQTGAIEVNVDPQAIRSVIESLSGYSRDIETVVFDGKGTILSSSDSSSFMRNISTEGWASRVLSSAEDTGSFLSGTGAKTVFVSYAKTGETGWNFVSLRPYGSMIGNIQRLRVLTCLAALALILLGFFLSINLSGAVYGPLKKIVDAIGQGHSGGAERRSGKPSSGIDEYEVLSGALSRYDEATTSLRSALRGSEVYYRKACVLALLRGSLDESVASQERIAALKADLEAPVYRVIVFRFDGIGSVEDPALLRYTVTGLADAILSRVLPCDAVSSGEDETAVLARTREGEGIDALVLAATEVGEETMERLGASITTGIGDPEYSLDDVPRSYRSGLDYCRYRLFFGPGAIIDADRVGERLDAVVRYPSAIEKKIIESLNTGNGEIIGDLVREFAADIAPLSYYQAINYANRLMLAIFRQFEDATELLDENFKDYYELAREIEECESLEGIADLIEDFCAKIGALLDLRNNLPYVKKNERSVEFVRQYLEEHYGEPGLSLESVADLVDLSPGYLGKLFKTIQGHPFNDVLSGIRLERARELLMTTNRPAAEICASVGLYNVTYFSTLFKKTYGYSPSRYRNRIK
jgi:two-component system, response regulator YesN